MVNIYDNLKNKYWEHINNENLKCDKRIDKLLQKNLYGTVKKIFHATNKSIPAIVDMVTN